MLAEMKKLAMCISLANLYFLELWVRLIYDRSPLMYFTTYTISDYTAIILNVIIMGLSLWFISYLIKHHSKLSILGIVIFGFVFVIIIKSFVSIMLTSGVRIVNKLLENITEEYTSFVINSFFFLFIFFIICLTVLAIIHRRELLNLIPKALLILFPFALITLTQAVWIIIDNYHYSTYEHDSAEVINSDTRRRVLWLIFDEMDQRVTFYDRPKAIDLPEIDRFREESIFATEAYPPHASTSISMPSLTTGRLATEVKSSTLYDLKLHFKDNEAPVTWSSQKNIFQAAKNMGLVTAAGGWGLPYHMVFNNYLDTTIQCSRREDNIFFKMLFQTTDVIPFIDTLTMREAIKHQEILEQTKEAVVNPDINLTFVHFMPPHAPWIYNRLKSDYNYNLTSNFWFDPEGHFDNLVLVDHTLGVLREVMETNNLWDSTTVLISSDHWWRSSQLLDGITDYRVPFMMKLAGQTKPVVFDRPFNTTLSHDLILSVLQGDLNTPEDVIDWLEENHSKIEITYRN